MWVNIIKADTPSINGNIYPLLMLEQAVLKQCQLYSSYGKPVDVDGFIHTNPPVGSGDNYRINNNWLQVSLSFSDSSLEEDIKNGKKVVRAAVICQTDPPAELKQCQRRIILQIDKIDHLAICDPGDASWVY